MGQLLQQGRDLGYNAFNITHPCKQLVLEHLDDVSDDARRLGAVNTVVIRDGKFIGHNTDFSGFGRGLEQGLPDAELGAVVQLGTGGAGSAVAYALLKKGLRRLTLLDLDPRRAAERRDALALLFPEQEVAVATMDQLPDVLEAADGVL